MAKELMAARKSYIRKQLAIVNGDGRNFCRVINTSFFSKSSAPITQIFDPKTDTLVHGIEAANSINHFFCNVSVDLST